jgi:biopolymer transport protein ExbD
MPRLKSKKTVVEDQDMNMSPMIDCVFLLLIFFMVTAVFKNAPALDLILPDAENSVKLDQKQLIAEIDADGNVALNGVVGTLDSFDAMLVNEKQKRGMNSLLIKADAAATHGNIITMMKLAKGVQIETISLATSSFSMGGSGE